MNRRATDSPSSDRDFARLRSLALRCFQVTLIDKDETGHPKTEIIWAHFIDCTYGPGHLAFVTTDRDQHNRIHDVFAFGSYKRVHEVVDDSDPKRLTTRQVSVKESSKKEPPSKDRDPFGVVPPIKGVH